MKKAVCICCVCVMILGLLTACNFNTNMTDSTGKTKMEALPQVEEMLQALAEEDGEKALGLMHPDAPNRSAQAIAQLSAYLSGRDVKSLEVQKLQKKNTSGTGGTKQQETATILVTMEDEEQFYLSVSYLTDAEKKGFVSFQLILGMV